MLPSQFRLRRTADVATVRQLGRRWQHPLIALFVYTQSHEVSSSSRFAFSVGRHIGKATRRNRVKRRLREIVRHHLDRLEPGYDCLFVVRSGAVMASHEELEKAVVQQLIRAGVINDGKSNPGSEGIVS